MKEYTEYTDEELVELLRQGDTEVMNVDLPTFGIPTTIARIGRFLIPLLLSLSIFALQASWITPWIDLSPAPDLAFTFTT